MTDTLRHIFSCRDTLIIYCDATVGYFRYLCAVIKRVGQKSRSGRDR